LTYAERENRCEGVLPRYVGYGDNIELIGFFLGKFNDSMPVAELSVGSPAGQNEALTIRALSLTSRLRYQMDALVDANGKFRWPLALLGKARSDIGIDTKAMGIVACTNRCANRPDTVYFPLSSAAMDDSARPPLTVRLRADTSARAVRFTLRSVVGGPVIESQLGRQTLNPDELTEITLPSSLASGEYRLDVRATNSESRQPMSPLIARIVVP